MQTILSILKKHANTLMKLLPLLAFAVPFLWLYSLDPGSFESLWKGRTFQLFFVWLIALELILGWESLQTNKINKPISARSFAFIIALLLPTVYVVTSNYLGLNTAIADASKQSGVQFWNSMPLSTEYLVFTVLFCLMVFLSFGKKGLTNFSVPAFFLGIVGTIYIIDNVYPYGQFTPFQFFVPTTATLAAKVLSLMGYNISYVTKADPFSGSMPYLTAADPNNPSRSATFAIAWPCAGIESFLIFTVVILLFLKRMPISWKAKIGYFVVGATVTYFINIMRVVTIFTIGMDYGVNSDPVQLFHFYYGPLYSIVWIVSYPLIILGSQSLWHKITNKKGQQKTSWDHKD
jgi:thaumarchaeosortase